MKIHTVEQGDTLFGIAKAYGIPLSRLEEANGIDDLRELIIGEDLIIPEGRPVTVMAGETLYSIAEREGVSVGSLLRSNPALGGIPMLYEGQTVYVFDEAGREIVVNGYAYPFIEESELRRALPYLTFLTVFTYGIKEDGGLIEADDGKILEIAREYGVKPLLLLSTLTDEGVFNNNLSSRVFSDAAIRERLISEVTETALSKGYAGVEIDFEYIPKDDFDRYVSFLRELKASLEPEGLLLFTALAPKTSDTQAGLLYEGHDYRSIGEVSDYVLLMTYEWGYQFGPPLAIAPIKNVEEVVAYAVSRIAPRKILLGIPNYGYDWPLPFIKGETEAKGISNRVALETAERFGAEIMFDEASKAPNYNYFEDGTEHTVWFENARSIAAKLALVEKYSLAGISIWQIMRFFPQLFGVLSSSFKIK